MKKKKHLERLISKTINFLETILNRLSPNIHNPIVLESLTPTNNADEDEVYCNALKSAIDNPKNLNIGITGSYGSGKSSILESFKKKYGSGYKILSISLAAFNVEEYGIFEKEEINEKINASSFEVNQLIELSILQQLLYHVKVKDLPNSRFKRIKRIRSLELFSWAFSTVIWVLSAFVVFEPEFIRT